MSSFTFFSPNFCLVCASVKNMNILFHVCNVTKLFATGAFSLVIETFVHFLEETGELGIGRECR